MKSILGGQVTITPQILLQAHLRSMSNKMVESKKTIEASRYNLCGTIARML